MNAPHVWRPMQLGDVLPVVAMEQAACLHPVQAWSADNYRSSLRSGYWTRICADVAGQIQGVCVAMLGVDEMHLLNIAVAKASQGRGLAAWMLAQLDQICVAHGLSTIWLEVRPSNAPALALYRAQQYEHVAVRKGYYPAVDGREDALVMRRQLPQEMPHVAME